MSNQQITIGMVGTTAVGRNQVKVEVTAVDGDKLTVRNLNTRKESEIKIARFTPDPAPVAAKAAATLAKATPEKKADNPKGEKKPGLLEKVAAILEGKSEPMTTGELIEALKAKGQLTLNGKTPKQTLYSSIYRAIQSGDRRFEKAGKNTFQYKG